MWEVGHLEINNLPVIKSAFSLEEPKSSGWLPFLAPLGRVCYMETGWDGRKGATVLRVFSPKWGWRK